MEIKEQKEYREERFEFALYVNDNVICKRNFRINNFIEDSMNSLEFKETVNQIVKMIDDDLKSKSRVYTWYFFDEKAQDNTYKITLARDFVKRIGIQYIIKPVNHTQKGIATAV